MLAIFHIILIQSPQREDHLEDSIDLDASSVDKNIPFLESFKIGGYDDDGQVKDLHVTVDDPEKHVGGYVSYNVTTKVGRYVTSGSRGAGRVDNPINQSINQSTSHLVGQLISDLVNQSVS